MNIVRFVAQTLLICGGTWWASALLSGNFFWYFINYRKDRDYYPWNWRLLLPMNRWYYRWNTKRRNWEKIQAGLNFMHDHVQLNKKHEDWP